MTRLVLLTAASATGTAKTVAFAGDYAFIVAGTFGGATVGLQVLGPDAATWIDVSDELGPLAITSATAITVSAPQGEYRAKITGGAGVSLYADLRHIGPVAP